MRRLTPRQVREQTGWSEYKVYKLIETGKLPAVDTSTGSTPRWLIREDDLAAFLTPTKPIKPVKAPRQTTRRKRLDSHVPDRISALVKGSEDMFADLPKE